MRHAFDPTAPVMKQLRVLGIPEHLAYRQFMVYRFMHGQTLLYVGVTCAPRGRFCSHSRSAGWWPLVTDVLIEWHLSERSALASEVAAIRSEAPEFNIRSAPRLMSSACAPQTLLTRNVSTSLSKSLSLMSRTQIQSAVFSPRRSSSPRFGFGDSQ